MLCCPAGRTLKVVSPEGQGGYEQKALPHNQMTRLVTSHLLDSEQLADRFAALRELQYSDALTLQQLLNCDRRSMICA